MEIDETIGLEISNKVDDITKKNKYRNIQKVKIMKTIGIDK